MKTLQFAIVSALLATAGCAHINPGQIIVSCAMDAANDGSIKQDVIDALRQSDWKGALDSLVGKIPGLTSEVLACILNSIAHSMLATQDGPNVQARARAYMADHGYLVR